MFTILIGLLHCDSKAKNLIGGGLSLHVWVVELWILYLAKCLHLSGTSQTGTGLGMTNTPNNNENYLRSLPFFSHPNILISWVTLRTPNGS